MPNIFMMGGSDFLGTALLQKDLLNRHLLLVGLGQSTSSTYRLNNQELINEYFRNYW